MKELLLPTRRLALKVSAAALASPYAWAANGAEKLRLAIVPGAHSFLPIFVAHSEKYFEQEGVEVEIVKTTQPQMALMPMLARGDLDLMPAPLNPAVMNASKAGFNIKVVASMSQERAGWSSANWIIVRKELHDAGKVRTINDIKGLRIDAGPPGSLINFAANMSLRKVGLARSEMQYATRLTLPDWLPAMSNGSVDVLSVFEPAAAELIKRGVAARLSDLRAVVGDVQTLFFLASDDSIKSKRAQYQRFFAAYARAAKYLTQLGPAWTEDTLELAARWTGVDKGVLETVSGPMYYGQLGKIDLPSLETFARYWVSEGLSAAQPIQSLVEPIRN